MDTRFHESIAKEVKDSDILVCESTYIDDNKDKAEEYMHLTSSQAGEIAKKANVEKLYLTHISQRYEMCEPKILKEAKKKFSKTIIAEDLMRVEI